MSTKVFCSRCNTVLNEDPSIQASQRIPCPSCGSISRRVEVFSSDSGRGMETVKLKARHQGKGEPFIEQVSGADLHRNSNEWTNIERIIDRENDIYMEVITDSKTGKIIHQCIEPLSEHQGHGSAKRKKNRNLMINNQTPDL